MRIPVGSKTLALLVGEELNERVAADARFTAYDITRTLRRRQPQLDIPHVPVKLLVHQYMTSLVATGHYHAHIRSFGAVRAVYYSPEAPVVDPGVIGLPLIGLN